MMALVCSTKTIRQFRVEASNLEDAVQKIFAKAPDAIGPPRIFQAVDGSYECQVEVKPIQNGKQENDIQVDIYFEKSELHQRLCGSTFYVDDTSCG